VPGQAQHHADKRQGEKRAPLLAERQAVLGRSWQAQGVLALQQAAQKLELAQQQREARKALQARYKPLPMYRQWKEAAQILGVVTLPAAGQHVMDEGAVTVAAVAQTLRLLTHTVDARQHVTYRLDGVDVFRDEWHSIEVLDVASKRGIAAALAMAHQRFGDALTVTGPLDFQKSVVAVSVESGLACRFSDAALEQLRQQIEDDKRQLQGDAVRATDLLESGPAAELLQTPAPADEAQDDGLQTSAQAFEQGDGSGKVHDQHAPETLPGQDDEMLHTWEGDEDELPREQGPAG